MSEKQLALFFYRNKIMHNKEILLHLSLIDEIAAATIAMAVCKKPNAIFLHDIYKMSAVDIMHSFDISHVTATKILQGLTDTKLLAHEQILAQKYNIQWSTVICPDYPEALKNIHLMPPVIYWQGQAPTSSKCVAIVGSRKANTYGQQVIEHLVPPLVQYGYSIISGGALGADAMAHHATLKAGGKTIAILGSGLLRPLPHSNKRLFEEIVSNDGTMLSTFPLQTEAFPHNFPARNRIISGLSCGTIVVQAAARSGTSITAHFALEQGKDVFAVPGSIYDELSAGCHALIAQGAKITTHADDILREFGENIPEAPKDNAIKKAKETHISKPQETQSSLFEPAKAVANDTSPTGIILRHCAKPCSVDDLMVETGLDLPSLNALLFNLRLDGKIDQNFTGMWQRQ